jgi:hypothetical protein
MKPSIVASTQLRRSSFAGIFSIMTFDAGRTYAQVRGDTFVSSALA